MGQVLPGRLDFESYAGDDFAVILAFTTEGAAYNVTAAEFSATITRASGDVTIGITQESASSLRLAITDTNLGTTLSQDRWTLRHTSTDRTWLAGDFVVSLNKQAGGGLTQANVVVDEATYTVNIASVATVPGGAIGSADEVSIDDVGGYYTGSTVEAALQEAAVDTAAVQTDLTAHTSDASDAHDASAISFAPTGTIAATDVQAAIAEVASEAGGFVAVEEEGAEVVAAATRFDFVGAGVTATDAGSGQATITIPGSSLPGAWTSYTPTWTGSTTNPTIGNGTLAGAYIEIGKTVHFRINLTVGSTTSVGSGTWRFSFPVTPHVDVAGFALGGYGEDAAVIGYVISAGLRVAGASTFSLLMHVPTSSSMGASNIVSHNLPHAWGNGDFLRFSGTYEAA